MLVNHSSLCVNDFLLAHDLRRLLNLHELWAALLGRAERWTLWHGAEIFTGVAFRSRLDEKFDDIACLVGVLAEGSECYLDFVTRHTGKLTRRHFEWEFHWEFRMKSLLGKKNDPNCLRARFRMRFLVETSEVKILSELRLTGGEGGENRKFELKEMSSGIWEIEGKVLKS
jgi:hypothetical protein